MADLHERAWFSIEGLPNVSESSTGSLAGTPLADIIFVCAFRRVLVRMRHELMLPGVWDIIHIDTCCDIFGIDPSETPIQHMDGLFVPVMSEAESLLDEAAKAMTVIVRTFALYGFKLI